MYAFKLFERVATSVCDAFNLISLALFEIFVSAAVTLVLADHPELRQHIFEMHGQGRKSLCELILARRDEISHPAPESAVPFFVDQLGAMVNARNDPNLRLAAIDESDDEAFIENILRFARDFLKLKS